MALARAVPAAWGLPRLGPGGVGLTVRVCFAILWAAAALEGGGGGSLELALPVGASALVWSAYALVEVLRGAALGFIAGLGLRAAALAGLWFGTWPEHPEGGGPESGADELPWRFFFASLGAVVFFRLGGLAVVTQAFVASYRAWPVGAAVAASSGLPGAVLAAAVRILESALGLVAPLLVASWIVDLTSAVLGRVLGLPGARDWSWIARALLPVAVTLLGFSVLEAALAIDVTSGLAGVARAVGAP
jgi:flagellar biosynthesis protein FliR